MKQKGIALVFVLTMMSVIVMMTGAFVVSNQANLATLGATMRQRDAQMACDSAIAFCTYTLEHNQRWGQTEFSANRDISPPGGGLRVRELRNTTSIEGAVLDETEHGIENTFTVALQNNLGNDLPRGAIGKDRVLLTVRARSGSFEYRRQVMLSGEPIYDAALTAQNGIQLNSFMDSENHIHLLPSTDAAGNPTGQKNWIRSNGHIILNGFVGPNSTGKQLSVGRTAGGQQGVIWAKGDIYAGSASGRAEDPVGVKLEGEALLEAQRRSGAQLAARSRLNNDIYDLKIEDLNVDMGRTEINMAAGVYRLKNQDIVLPGGGVAENIKTLEYIAPNGQKLVFFDGRTTSDAALDALGLPDNYVASDADGVVRLNRFSGSGPSMTFRFADNLFQTSENATVRVNGSLAIYSEIDGQTPRVKLAEGNTRGVLRATGNIQINGTLMGGGAVLADGDVWLQANEAGTGSSVDVDAGGGDVVIYGNRVGLTAGGSNRVAIKGLIYAKEDFGVHGGVTVTSVGEELRFIPETRPLDKLVLEGAVVAKNGGISIVESREMYLKYNEQYLQALTRGLYTTSRYPNCRRIRQLWSRS